MLDGFTIASSSRNQCLPREFWSCWSGLGQAPGPPGGDEQRADGGRRSPSPSPGPRGGGADPAVAAPAPGGDEAVDPGGAGEGMNGMRGRGGGYGPGFAPGQRSHRAQREDRKVAVTFGRGDGDQVGKGRGIGLGRCGEMRAKTLFAAFFRGECV